MTNLLPVSIVLACLSIFLIGLNAGFFYTWSFTITQALDLVASETAIAAMQSINANIRNGWFGAIAFGAPVMLFCTALILLLMRRFKPAVVFFSALFAVVVTLAVTMAVHVPMNSELARITAASGNTSGIWINYSTQWTLWNHLRSAASCIAFGLSIVGLIELITLSVSRTKQNRSVHD